jgi:hypothetical protein
MDSRINENDGHGITLNLLNKKNNDLKNTRNQISAFNEHFKIGKEVSSTNQTSYAKQETTKSQVINQTTPPAADEPASEFLMPGVSSENIIQIERMFDDIQSNIIIFRCEITGNMLDGIHSQDYHLTMIGGSAKQNTGALVRLKNSNLQAKLF